MRTPLFAIVLSIVGGAVCAQPASETIKDLESCFELARAADVICSNPAHSAIERVDCFRKTRQAQLECLTHIPSGKSAQSAPPEKPPEEVSPETPTGNIVADEPAGSPKTPHGTVPPTPSPTVSPNELLPDVPSRTADTPAISPDTNWVISETESPLDYSPILTAVISSPSNVKDAPNILAIRCRGVRTELVVRTQGTWRPPRTNELQVDFQVDDRPTVRRVWIASADRKSASYKDEAIGLLRSLPDGARLKISVFDWQGPGHEATFQLAGLNAVRQKIELACKWPPIADKMSSEKR